ncbi:hypothetical protein OZ411_33670 [Bradyrhizobium sp. Arg237L]|uniref:hypothetical protein n=1 Tax=Bradyrhizobium sp. Arg237L TaxID=3003352 RepID=UPI00249F11B2|nr:hypothetical protein [Bradyrhizobium sp. Arg237L]MDI4237764.1 hypothetical protein [Bradyrhizobium sp. Arg237L]
MTTIGVLGRIMSAATGIPESTMAVTARELRRQGILTSEGKGGFGAAEMSPADAASLLLAAMAAEGVKDSPDAARAFSGLPGKKVRPPQWARQRLVSEFEHQVGEDPPLLWSLSKLLALLKSGVMFPVWAETPVLSNVDRPRQITVSLFKPEIAASIEISQNKFYVGYRYGALAGLENEGPRDIVSLYEEKVVAPRYPEGYIIKTARIGMKGLEEIAHGIMAR